MKIFTDHCVHTGVVKALRSADFKVESAIDIGLHNASDEKIFNYAVKTSQILLSFDKDFCNIVRFDIINSHGVVVFYIKDLDKDIIINRVIDFFRNNTYVSIKWHLNIIESSGKIRKWPTTSLTY